MRKIQFRGKRVNGGDWVYGMTISHGTIKRKINNVFFEISENKWVGVIPDTVGQFTGLHDKNSKEIYEGDIIKTKQFGRCSGDKNFSDYDVFLIIYHNAGFCLENSNRRFSLIKGWHTEIIGNIHDNPELLKGGQNE